MSVKSDRWIRRMALEHRMIEPFHDKQVREGVISYGVSSYGYDIRIADEFKIFTNVNSSIVDPKKMDPASMVDFGMSSAPSMRLISHSTCSRTSINATGLPASISSRSCCRRRRSTRRPPGRTTRTPWAR